MWSCEIRGDFKLPLVALCCISLHIVDNAHPIHRCGRGLMGQILKFRREWGAAGWIDLHKLILLDKGQSVIWFIVPSKSKNWNKGSCQKKTFFFGISFPNVGGWGGWFPNKVQTPQNLPKSPWKSPFSTWISPFVLPNFTKTLGWVNTFWRDLKQLFFWPSLKGKTDGFNWTPAWFQSRTQNWNMGMSQVR